MVNIEQITTDNNQQRPVNHFKARIELLARKNNISLGELAERLGVSAPSLFSVLRLGRPSRSRITTDRLCSVLNVDPSQLFAAVSNEEYGAAYIPRFDFPTYDQKKNVPVVE